MAVNPAPPLAVSESEGEALRAMARAGTNKQRTAGARLVEIYSAFIYRGWRAPVSINRELLDVMSAERIAAVSDIGGTAVATAGRRAGSSSDR